jgi:alanine dehydrogenase
MRTLLVSHREVAGLLPMKECIEAMADAFRALAIGEAQLPLRQVIPLPNSPNLLALMPGQLGSVTRERHRSSIGAKVITVFPGNDATPLDSHLGVVLLFEADTGTLLAIIDASSVTAMRTAAVLGAGVQAMTHLDAMRCVRPIRRVRIWSRSPERRARFVEKARQQFGISVEPSATVEMCVEGADIICTVTASRQPVLDGTWIAEGAHINAVGAALPIARELDSATVAKSRLYVDRRESALAEAGDILIPIAEGVISADHIRGELGEVLLGVVPARGSPGEVTLFKSLGLAIEDLAAARLIYEKGVALGTGVWVSLGGLRET